MSIDNFELFDEPRKSWWNRLTASDGDWPPTLRTYVTLWGGGMNRSLFPHQPELEIWGQETPSEGGEAPPLLAPTGAAEVFQAGMSASRQPIGQIASPGFRVPFQEALLSEPSEIAVERPTVENWFK